MAKKEAKKRSDGRSKSAEKTTNITIKRYNNLP